MSLLVAGVWSFQQTLHAQQPATTTTTTTKPATRTVATTRAAPATTTATAGTRPTSRPTTVAATVPTTAPTTAAVAPPPPPPKAVVIAFAAAINRGDAAAAKTLALPDEAHGQWIDSTVALAAGLKKLDAAAVARFGDAGRKVSQNGLGMTTALGALEQGQEKIEGDRAVVNGAGMNGGTLGLRRGEHGKWLIELPVTDAQRARTRKLYDLLIEAAGQTAAEVSAGRHPSADAAKAAFEQRVLRARIRAG